MRDAPQFFGECSPFAWFAMLIWPVWVVPFSSRRSEAPRRTAALKDPRSEATNVIDLEAYRLRMLSSRHEKGRAPADRRTV